MTMMKMMNFFVSIASFLAIAPPMVLGCAPPGADTPLFYLVSSSQTSSVNLLPMRTGTLNSGYATLNGSSEIAKLFFIQGNLALANADNTTWTYHLYINSEDTGTDCLPGGPVGFVQNSGSNKCARNTGFQLQSNTENSQLGARLSFNLVGGFYACGPNNQIYYKVNATESPSGCASVDLYTVPV